MIQKFPNNYQLVNGNTKEFIFLLKKVIYAYEYMDNWDRFNETELLLTDKFLFKSLFKKYQYKRIWTCPKSVESV